MVKPPIFWDRRSHQGIETQLLEVPETLYVEAVGHARRDYPNECCGLIAGLPIQGGFRAERIYQMENVEHSPLAYRLDPREQLKIFDEIDDAGLELISIYHSHTHSPAYPSATDIRLAYYPDSYYVIISLSDPDAPDIRAFSIIDGQVNDKEVKIVR